MRVLLSEFAKSLGEIYIILYSGCNHPTFYHHLKRISERYPMRRPIKGVVITSREGGERVIELLEKYKARYYEVIVVK